MMQKNENEVVCVYLTDGLQIFTKITIYCCIFLDERINYLQTIASNIFNFRIKYTHNIDGIYFLGNMITLMEPSVDFFSIGLLKETFFA